MSEPGASRWEVNAHESFVDREQSETQPYWRSLGLRTAIFAAREALQAQLPPTITSNLEPIRLENESIRECDKVFQPLYGEDLDFVRAQLKVSSIKEISSFSEFSEFRLTRTYDLLEALEVPLPTDSKLLTTLCDSALGEMWPQGGGHLQLLQLIREYALDSVRLEIWCNGLSVFYCDPVWPGVPVSFSPGSDPPSRVPVGFPVVAAPYGDLRVSLTGTGIDQLPDSLLLHAVFVNGSYRRRLQQEAGQGCKGSLW